jgi:predicted metal-dependent hydrolase
MLNPFRRHATQEFLAIGERQVPMVLIRNLRARRYVLRLRPDGVARVTIPRGGSAVEARRFVERNKIWLDQQFQKNAARPVHREQWLVGTGILFRGEVAKIESGVNGEAGWIRLSDELIKTKDLVLLDLRPVIESHLWKLADKELPARVLELATLHHSPVRRITVRNQKLRWGSCSRRGTISLNWRLIQTPLFVSDYIILHELMHLRQMNHSARFWREVKSVCPNYGSAEQWLKKHSRLLR